MMDDPQELSPELHGPDVWAGPEMAARSEWLETLSPAEVAEVEAAALALAGREADIATLRLADFALPGLAPRLARIREDVLRGRGFALIRGLPVRRWPLRLAATAFFGLGLHFGHAVSQNARGHVLGHVRDLGLRSDDPNVRIYQTAERQTFHIDSCDIVGLMCLQEASAGGDSALVSTGAVWNALRHQRPDLAALLLQPMTTDRRGEVPSGERPFFTIPALHFLMRLQPGDVQLVHNHALLHDRTAFTDWPEPERRRHLLRLWLAPGGCAAAAARVCATLRQRGARCPGRCPCS